jgi:hypothetical protein
MNKKTRLVPANDNMVPGSFQSVEIENDVLDSAIGAVMDREIIAGRRCQCALINSVPAGGSDD